MRRRGGVSKTGLCSVGKVYKSGLFSLRRSPKAGVSVLGCLNMWLVQSLDESESGFVSCRLSRKVGVSVCGGLGSIQKV